MPAHAYFAKRFGLFLTLSLQLLWIFCCYFCSLPI